MRNSPAKAKPVSYRLFWASLIGTLICIGPVIWLILANDGIAIHWRIFLGVVLIVFVIASLATTEILPWHARSLTEWRQPKVLGSLTLLLLGAAAYVAGIANGFGPDPARQDTLLEVSSAVGASPASAAELQLWKERDAGSCEAVENYLRHFPKGRYSREAMALLATKREVASKHAVITQHDLPITEIPDGEVRASVSLAQSHAIARAQRQADRLCALYVAEKGGKMNEAHVQADRWTCDARACGFEGRAICSIESPQMMQICGKGDTK